jgi:Protein of unknown function (DUF3800)
MALELTAYCDESGTQSHDFVLAGYLAPASEWLGVAEAWERGLREAGLTEFKASDCYAGQGEFKNRSDRLELREKFFSIIDLANVDGFAVRIDLTTFGEVHRKLEGSIRPGFNKAYLHAFSAQLQFMTEHVSRFPRDERIGFVFDEQDEFSGRALQMFEHLKVMPEFVRGHRLGGISFEDSKKRMPLQAADALAHRIHRDLLNALPAHRSKIQDARRIRVALLGSDAIVDLPEPG